VGSVRPMIRRPVARRLRRRIRQAWSSIVWPEALRTSAAGTVVCHDWLISPAGSDKVAAHLTEIADAEVLYTFALDPTCTERLGITVPAVTWRFGRQVAHHRCYQLLLPLMPVIWASLDLDAARVVVTSSHSCVNAIHAPAARRLCYCHTPMRYAWDWRLERHRVPRPLRPVLPVLAAVLRAGDRRWSRRVDAYVANSAFVADRIMQAYGRSAVVVHPPTDLAFWRSGCVSEHDPSAPFLFAGRLVAYKRADLAVRAATEAGVPLVVAGAGPELHHLERIAGPTVRFVGAPDDDELRRLVCDARALVQPGVEDFGMLALEARAAGTPVIARHEGGASETVIDSVTGVLIEGDDLGVWAGALREFRPEAFDSQRLSLLADDTAPNVFHQRIAAELASLMDGS
jgi:glycosyltransferase involved in cell wall biosynthesis